MRIRHGVAVLVLVGVFASPAKADIIVLDPNTYAIGTDVSEILPGLSMSIVAGQTFWEAVYSPVVVSGGGYGSYFGSLDLGRTYYAEYLERCTPGMGGPTLGCDHHYRLQEFRFDAPTDFLQISAAAGADGFGMYAYDAAGNQIGSCGFLWGGTSGDPGCVNLLAPFSTTSGNHGTLTFRREQDDISRVVFGGLAGTASITGVQYSVPEPSSLAAILIGVAAFQLRRRRRR